jgi:outer membrane biogenesis lipoprotein LolB
MQRAVRLVAAALLAAACVHRAPLPPAEWPLSLAEVQADVERLVREGESRRSLRAAGKLRVRTPDRDGRVREIILAQRPDRLRLESLSPLGQAVGLLVTDGTRYSFFDGERIESGEVSGELLRHVGLALQPGEAVEVLLAAPPVDSRPRALSRVELNLVLAPELFRAPEMAR